MSKDWLDQYKKMLDVMINDESEMHRNRLKDTAFYFYKQAIERVQELESIISQNESVVTAIVGEEVMNQQGTYKTEMQKNAKQNKHYRETLEFYANKDNYKLEHFDPNLNDYMSTVDYDEGQKARHTLEEST